MGEMPGGTVTLLFTDIEASTQLLRALGDDYPPLLAAHFGLITDAVDRHGGVQGKLEGDGMLAVFADAPSALAAAVDAQRALQAHAWPAGTDVRVRMGLHTGDATVHDGEYVGLGIHQAARVVATAHGGQIVCSATTADAASGEVLLRDLGAYALRDFDRPEHVFQVDAPALASEFPALRARPAVAHNLPTIRTGFVGRDRELRDVTKLLVLQRLVTVVGAGGVGKTRLSFELARQEASSYFDGAVVVLLASVSADRVVAAIADAVGVREEQGRPLRDTVAAALARRHMLLVLDNCEHVVEVVADVLDEVLDRTDGVVIVATSRRPLDIPGEAVYQLGPLDPPSPDDPAESLAANDAVRLFVERAQAASSTFRLDHESGTAVAQICRQVDGLPLALELAAARVRSLPVAALADRLADTVSMLTTGPRSVDERQRTVTALVDWSYDLLTEDERRLFARLSVFRGGFDLEAAEAVCAGAPLSPVGILDLLDALVQHSLVTLGEGGRYRMLVVVRDVAATHLAAAEADDARGRHLAHFAAVARAQPVGWWDRIGDELDNIRAALAWGFEGAGDAETATALLVDVWRFVKRRGFASELQHWNAVAPAPRDPHVALTLELRRLTVIPATEADARVDALEPEVRATGDATDLAWFQQRRLDAAESLGHPAETLAAVKADIDVVRAEAEPTSAARFFHMLSWNSYRVGDLNAAQQYAAEGAAIADRLDDPEPAADFAYLRAVYAVTVGDTAATADHVRAALKGYEQTGSIALVQVWNVQAAMHLLTGDIQAAVNAYEETATASRRAGLRHMEAIAQANLADALTTLGRFDAAAHAIAEGSRVAEELGLLFVQHLLISFSGNLAYTRGDLDAMEVALARSAPLAEQMGTPDVRARTTQTRVQLLLARGDARAAADAARAGIADYAATEQGDASGLLAAALAVAGLRDDAVRAAAVALRAPRPYVALTPRLGVLLAIALGGEDAVRLASSARTAARQMHLVLPQPEVARVENVLAEVRAELGAARFATVTEEASSTPLAEILDVLTARLAATQPA